MLVRSSKLKSWDECTRAMRQPPTSGLKGPPTGFLLFFSGLFYFDSLREPTASTYEPGTADESKEVPKQAPLVYTDMSSSLRARRPKCSISIFVSFYSLLLDTRIIKGRQTLSKVKRHEVYIYIYISREALGCEPKARANLRGVGQPRVTPQVLS